MRDNPSKSRPSDSQAPPRVVLFVRSLEAEESSGSPVTWFLERGTSHTSVVGTTRLGPLGERLVAKGGEVHVLANRDGGARALLEMGRVLRRGRPHVVHYHNMFAHCTAGSAPGWRIRRSRA